MNFLKKILLLLISLAFVSCATTGVSYTSKFFKDAYRDDSFQKNSPLVATGSIKDNISIKPVITDISGMIRNSKKKDMPPFGNDIVINGELIKHGLVNTSEFAFVFLLGLDTDYFTLEGSIDTINTELPVFLGIYYLHDNNGNNHQFYTTEVRAGDWVLTPMQTYHGEENASPFLMFKCISQSKEYYVFITQTLNWSVSGSMANNKEYVEANWPRIGIKSLLTMRSQVLQICDKDFNVLAEIKNNNQERIYDLFIPDTDEQYTEVSITIGLVESYVKSLKKLDQLTIN